MSHKENSFSSIPELDVPEFKPSIPDALLKDLSPEMKWLMEQQSVINQKADWLVKQSIDTNIQMRKTDNRVARLEVWKNDVDVKIKRNEKEIEDQSVKLDKVKGFTDKITHGWGGITMLGVLVSAFIGSTFTILRLVDLIKNLW